MKNKMDHKNKKLYQASRFVFVLFSAASFFIAIADLILGYLTPVSILTGGGCYKLKICDAVEAFPVFLVLFFVVLISGVVSLKSVKRKRNVFLIILVIIFSFSLMFSGLQNVRCKTRDAARKSDLMQTTLAQELYYDKMGKYAERYEELVSENVIYSVPNDPRSGEIYNDSDGYGLDGGDENDNTWSVRALLEKPIYKYCWQTSKQRWFICNQSGCNEVVSEQ